MTNKRRTISIASSMLALLIASMVLAHRADDWTRFDHRSFRVAGVPANDSLLIETANGKRETVTLRGIDAVDSAKPWLTDHALNHDVTLMLESPQTRDSTGRLRAFVFVDNQDLNVELVKAGLAYADRREKTVMDGLIDPAEAEARKKKRGLWDTMTYEQMPAWRKAWLRSLPPGRARISGEPNFGGQAGSASIGPRGRCFGTGLPMPSLLRRFQDPSVGLGP